jgi:hypothetical protein
MSPKKIKGKISGKLTSKAGRGEKREAEDQEHAESGNAPCGCTRSTVCTCVGNCKCSGFCQCLNCGGPML